MTGRPPTTGSESAGSGSAPRLRPATGNGEMRCLHSHTAGKPTPNGAGRTPSGSTPLPTTTPNFRPATWNSWPPPSSSPAAAPREWTAWPGMNLILLGEPARSAGWLARAHRIVDDLPEPCPCEGLLSIPAGLDALYQGNGATAAEAFTRAAHLGRARGDADSAALGTLGLGQAKILLGEFDDGLALLDEAMVAVTVGEISPVPAGIIYCAVIETCHLAFDLHRAHEWTRALDRWCDAQQNVVAFSGQCQMHRAELYRLHGAWTEAIDAAKTAQDIAF